MSTISELLKMAVSNIYKNEGSQISYSVGLAQVDQERKLLDKGYPVTTELNDILSLPENEDCQLDITKYLS